MGNFFRSSLLVAFISLVGLLTTSCGGGSSNDDPKPQVEACPESDPLCNSIYEEIAIECDDGRIWVTLNDDNPQLECKAVGRREGEVSFSDMSSKDEITWGSSNSSVIGVSAGSSNMTTVTAVSLGEAFVELTYLVGTDDSEHKVLKRVVVKETDEPTKPVADAGEDQDVLGGDIVNLSASGSYDYDGQIVQYTWVSDGVELTSFSSIDTSFTAPELKVDKQYNVVLSIIDNDEAVATDSVTINVSAVIPTAAGNGTKAHEGNELIIDASESYFDLENNPETRGIKSYLWEQVDIEEGYEIVLSDPTQKSISFLAPDLLESDKEQGKELKFKLTVENIHGKKDSTVVTATILNKSANIPPDAIGGVEVDDGTGKITIEPSLDVFEKDYVCLNGSQSKDDDAEAGAENNGIVSYEWIPDENNEYVISPMSGSRACFNAPSKNLKVDSLLKIKLKVTDAEAATGEKVITVNVKSKNQDPVITNIDYTISNGIVTLEADVSDQDDDGKIQKYTWTETDQHIVDLANTNKNTTTFTAPVRKVDTTYTISLEVEDDEGATVADTIDVKVLGIDLTPTNVSIEFIDDDSSKIVWDDMGAKQYHVYFGSTENFTKSETYKFVATDPEKEITHKLFGLDENTTYYYLVVSEYEDGEMSNDSSVIAFLPAPEEVELEEDIARPVPEKEETVSYMAIKWKHVGGASSYKVIWKRNDGLDNLGPNDLPVNGVEIIDDFEVDHDGYVTYENRSAFAIYRSSNGSIEPNRYYYQVVPVYKNGNVTAYGRISKEKGYYALASRWKALHKSPDSRENYMVVSAKDEVDGHLKDVIYIIGGEFRGFYNAPLPTLYAFYPDEDKWELKSPMPKSILNAAACTDGKNIYVIGGMNHSNTGGSIQSSVFKYNIENDEWNIEQNDIIKARMGASCFIDDSYIYLVGGTNSDFDAGDSIEVAGVDANGTLGYWSESVQKLSDPRVWHGIVKRESDYLVIGGVAPEDYFYAQNYIFNTEIITLGEYGLLQVDEGEELEKGYVLPAGYESESTNFWGLKEYSTEIFGFGSDDIYDASPTHCQYSFVMNENSCVSLQKKSALALFSRYVVAGNNAYAFWYYAEDTVPFNSAYPYVKYDINEKQWSYLEVDTPILYPYQTVYDGNDSLYLIGLEFDIGLQRYDISSDSVEVLESPTETRVERCFLKNNLIYCLGVGFEGEGNFLVISKYDIPGNSWLSSMTLPIDDSVDDGDLEDISMTQVDNNVFIILNSGNILTFNLDSQQALLTHISNGGLLDGGDDGSMLYLSDRDSFLLTGILEKHNSADFKNLTLELDYENKKWIEKTSLDKNRIGTSLVEVNQRALWFFTLTEDERDLSVLQYETEDDSWRNIGAFVGENIKSQSGHYVFTGYSPVVIDGMVYFIGGKVGSRNSSQKWVFY